MMDTTSKPEEIDVAKKILASKDDRYTRNLKRTREIQKDIKTTQEHALATFARVQLAMAENFTASTWPVTRLKEYAEAFLMALCMLETNHSKLIVASSPIEHSMGLGTGVTPAELEGARIRAEQEHSTND